MPTPFTARLIVVVTAAARDQAAARIAQEPDAGETAQAALKTLDVPLSASGSLPATHYWCSWSVRPALAARITAWVNDPAFPARAANVTLFDGLTMTPDQVLTTMGLKRIEAAI